MKKKLIQDEIIYRDEGQRRFETLPSSRMKTWKSEGLYFRLIWCWEARRVNPAGQE